jgi:Mn2+/Fe2+ NRAMP family transporter
VWRLKLYQRLKPLRARLLVFLAVLGPGVITAAVDNDAGGITTYSVAGATFGFSLLWILFLTNVAMLVVQEMSARLGVITGQGLGGLIREKLGVRWTILIIGILVFTNLANTVSEFAGVAASMEIFGVSKFISVPVAAIAVWLLVVRGSLRAVERIFLVASALFFAYVIAGVLARPDWPQAIRATFTPSLNLSAAYVTLAVTVIGTTIAPWMQFYQQSAIADKGLRPADLGYERADVIGGTLFSNVISWFIVVTCAVTIFAAGRSIQTAKDAALALEPLAGRYASILFALGLLNASVFAASILPLSTAYAVAEAFGWESAVGRSLDEAPRFYGLYTALIILGAGIILLPIRSLIQAMLASQTLNGVLLPVILIVMLVLVNDRRLMGRYVNGLVQNVFSWVTVGALILLTIMLVLTNFAPGLFGG